MSKRFQTREQGSFERKSNTREEKKVKEELPKVVFSFKDFDVRQSSTPGQTYNQWQKDGLLAYMMEKFGEICKYSILEARQMNLITVYGSFPAESKFKYPKTVIEDKSIVWATIQKIGGQKPRVAGHIIGNVFYVVFLDAEHLFWPSEKKNT